MCETLIIKVKTLNLLVINVYRPPNCTLEKFEETIEVCQKAINDVSEKDPKIRDILQFGDYNLKCISWPNKKIYVKNVENKSEEKQQAELLVKYVEESFMENYIYKATRGRNILDLVFSNNHLLINNYTITINNKLSDHNLITVKLNFSYNQETKVKKVSNPYSTKIFEYETSNNDEATWRRFDAILMAITKDFDDETKSVNTDEKLQNFYIHLEKATSIVFDKKKDFQEMEDKAESETKDEKRKLNPKTRYQRR